VLLLGLFAWTIRRALRGWGAGGVWATLTLWVVMGIPAVLDHDDRAHGHPFPHGATNAGRHRDRHDLWRGGVGVAGVLCGLAALGYHGIATAVGVVREQPA
jgi:hypothetical protein